MLYNQRPNQSTSSSVGEEMVGKAMLSVSVAMAAVGLQIGLEKAFQVIGGSLVAALFGAAIPVLVVAAFQGVINALLIQLFFGQSGLEEAREARIRGFVVAAITGAAIGLTFAAIFEASAHGSSDAGGDSSGDFFPIILAIAIVMVCAGIVGAVVSVLLNRGLMMLGLRVAAQLTEEGSGRLVEEIAPDFLKHRWWQSDDEQKKDEAIALVKGLATGTRWLTTCNEGNSNAFVRGVFVGMISGVAVFHLEQSLHGPDYGFWWQVAVELLATIAGVVGGSLILAFIVAIFRYALQLLAEIVGLAFLMGIIFLLFKACN